ncbi:hypothetical protein ABBQ38_002853 [Trebouxia sp. C0009 RCD-2024]
MQASDLPGDLRNFYSIIPNSVEAPERSTAVEGASQPPSSEALNTNGTSNNSDQQSILSCGVRGQPAESSSVGCRVHCKNCIWATHSKNTWQMGNPLNLAKPTPKFRVQVGKPLVFRGPVVPWLWGTCPRSCHELSALVGKVMVFLGKLSDNSAAVAKLPATDAMLKQEMIKTKTIKACVHCWWTCRLSCLCVSHSCTKALTVLQAEAVFLDGIKEALANRGLGLLGIGEDAFPAHKDGWTMKTFNTSPICLCALKSYCCGCQLFKASSLQQLIYASWLLSSSTCCCTYRFQVNVLLCCT